MPAHPISYNRSMATIAKNTTVMTVASIGQKLTAFAYFALIARFIGVDDLGLYTTALAFTTILVVFVDLGLTNVLVREVARNRDEAQHYLSTLLSVKVILALLSYGALVGLVSLLDYEPQLRLLILVSGMTMILDSTHLALYGTLRGFQTLRYEALGMFGSQLLTLILGTTFLLLDLPLVCLVLAFTIPSFLNVLYAAWRLYASQKIVPRLRFHRSVFTRVWRTAIPFALAAIFARVYAYVDTLLLQKLLGNDAAGFYSIAQKITYAFQFIPLALIAGLYPKLSASFAAKNKEQLVRLFERSVQYVLLVAFPVAVGIATLASPIVALVFGPAYLPSVLPLQIMILSVIFTFLSFPIGAFLNACNKQATQTTIVGVVMGVNIILNSILIPRYGPAGAASAAAASNALLALLGYVFVPRVASVPHVRMMGTAIRIASASLAMAFVVQKLEDVLPLFPLIVVGAVVYAAALFALRGLTKEELYTALAMMRAKEESVQQKSTMIQ